MAFSGEARGGHDPSRGRIYRQDTLFCNVYRVSVMGILDRLSLCPISISQIGSTQISILETNYLKLSSENADALAQAQLFPHLSN